MLYLSQLLHKPILDKSGKTIGEVSDLAVNTRDVFPRVVALTYKTDDDTQRMLSWSKYVAGFALGGGSSDDGNADGDGKSVSLPDDSTDTSDIKSIRLNADQDDLDLTHLGDGELQLNRDLMHKQIVDVKEKRVARVSDLKLSSSGLEGSNELRLLGAECGLQGRLRSMSKFKATCATAGAALTGKKVEEQLIAWNYIDIPSRDMSNLELSVSHKRLKQLRPADIADIIEQLDPKARAGVFAHLDEKDAAETISELEEIYQADVIEGLPEDHAVSLLTTMEPDDATDILSGLDYEKAEKILRLMGIEDAHTIRTLMGYRKNSAGGMMTPAVIVATEDMTVAETTQHLSNIGTDKKDIHCIYVVEKRDEQGLPDANSRLLGVVTLVELLVQDSTKKLGEFAHYNVVSASPDEDQEIVAQTIAKYNLLALPVIDAAGHLLGVVTVDDVIGTAAAAAAETQGEVPQFKAVPNPEKDKPKLLDSGTVGEEVASFFRSFGKAISWVLPKPLGWAGIWLAFPIGIYLGNLFMLNRFEAIFEAGGEASPFLNTLGTSFEVLNVSLMVLPFILLVIHGSVIRGIKLHTDSVELAPQPLVRYVLALLIATLTALLGFVLIIMLFLLNPLNLGIIPAQEFLGEFWGFSLGLALIVFLPLFIALLITTLFAAWRVGAIASAQKWGMEIRPSRIAFAAMLVFALSFAALSYPASHMWHVMNPEITNEGDWDGEYWGDEYLDWGDGYWGDEDFFLDEDMMDWGDIDLGDLDWDGEELFLEDLFDLEDFGE